MDEASRSLLLRLVVVLPSTRRENAYAEAAVAEPGQER